MNDYELKRIIEAVLFVSEKPMTVQEIWHKLFRLTATAGEATGEAANEDDETCGHSEVAPSSERASDASVPEDSVPEDNVPEDNVPEDNVPEAGVQIATFEITKDDVARVIDQLQQDYLGRGCELKEVASGYRFQVNEDLALWVHRWKAEKPPRYSRAVLETLAIIAYKQPITRAEIEDIRGVAVSSHIVRGLLEREWVRVVGHKELPGRPALFATTKRFLDYFNINSLEELPTLAEIRELGVRRTQDGEDEAPAASTDGASSDDAPAELSSEALSEALEDAVLEETADGASTDVLDGEALDGDSVGDVKTASVERGQIEADNVIGNTVEFPREVETTETESTP